MEAPLALSDELGNVGDDPFRAEILLVSAPGAVGKSTLAREIACRTNSIYVDLAAADPVGANTLTGGLAKSRLFDLWQEESTAVLIDGLDEARLRVTQDAYIAFLDDIVDLAKGRQIPTVLFGRTGAVQDTWLLLDGHSVSTAVLEIGYYDYPSSVEFAAKRLNADSPHAAREREAIAVILKRLREQTECDGDRFAGYAPVLQAVAQRVSDEGNAGAIVAQIEKGERPITLRTVANGIMERERSKLKTLPLSDKGLLETLYLADEQLDRLVARRYRLDEPPLRSMSAEDEQIYRSALENWVEDHPFMKPGTNEPSSAVFDALISTWALKGRKSSEPAVQQELRRGSAANPFLSEFYVPETGFPIDIPPAHIGVVYSSFRARLSLGDTASLIVSAPEEGEDEDALRGEVEISLVRRDASARTIRFRTEQLSSLRLGAYVEDVEVTAPHMDVDIGPGPETIFVAPVSIQCNRLRISSPKIVVEAPPVGLRGGSVFLEASHFESEVASLPLIRGDVSLATCWPGVRVHPWTTFASEPTKVEDPKLEEALRRFRKFIIAFRSHSKGSLARFKDKLDHERMTKGTGQSVLNLLLRERIISLDGPMYHLDPDLLGSKASTSYKDCMERRFSPATIAFVRKALL